MGIRQLAAAYVHRDHDRNQWVLENELRRLLAEDPENAWTFIEAAVDVATTVDDLGYIGAGPLEDLMTTWGGAFADRLADKVRVDARWAYATGIIRGAAGAEEAQGLIASIWPDVDAAARARLTVEQTAKRRSGRS